jgi:hypothetical protein
MVIDFIQQTQVDELMMVSNIFAFEDRINRQNSLPRSSIELMKKL